MGSLLSLSLMVLGIHCGGKAHHHTPGTSTFATTVCTWKDNKVAAYTPTFDDGLYDSLVLQENALKAHGLVGSMALITNWIDGGKNLEGFSIGTWAQFKAMLDRGTLTVASHTADHKNLTTLSAADMDAQFQESADDILKNTGYKAEVLFYPLSKSNATVDAEAAKYFIGARTSKQDVVASDTKAFYEINSFATDATTTAPIMNAWLDKGLSNKGWVIICSHGCDGTVDSYEPTPISTFDSHWGYVQSQSSRVWNAGFAEIVKYIREREAASIKVDSADASKGVVELTDSLTDQSTFNIPLTLKTQVPYDWNKADITQGSAKVTVPVMLEGDKTFVYYSAAPNGGKITITQNGVVLASPGIPEGLAGNATSTSQINISWTALEGATTYDLMIDGATVAGVTSPYLHTGLSPASAHTYQVRGRNYAGAGNWSSEVSVTSKDMVIPAVPIDVQAIAGSDQITLKWFPSEGATSYDIQVDGATILNHITGSPYLQTGLAIGETHSYQIRAVNSKGASGWCAAVSATTVAELFPNGGFEDGNLAPMAIDTGSAGGTEDAIAVVTDQAHTGTHSVRIKNLKGTDVSTYTITENIYGLTPGASYTFTFWSLVGPGASMAIYPYFLDNWDGTPPTDDTIVIADGTTWQKHTLTFTLPAGDTGFTFYLANTDAADPASDNFIWLDDFSLTKN